MRPDPALKQRRQVVAETVDRIRDGDPDAFVEFFELARPGVRRIVLRSFQTSGMWIDGDRVEDVVQDCIVELLAVLPSWRADGGALPWTWAASRMIATAHHRLGDYVVDVSEYDDVAEETWVLRSDVEEDVLVTLDRLALTHPEVADIRDVVERSANERDRRVWLDLLCEEAAGNDRAAVTVAARYGLGHANVRKIRQRVSARVAESTALPRSA
jgi:DNA-directed RNA polymerase specialized sigma24 family protein